MKGRLPDLLEGGKEPKVPADAELPHMTICGLDVYSNDSFTMAVQRAIDRTKWLKEICGDEYCPMALILARACVWSAMPFYLAGTNPSASDVKRAE